MDYFRPVLRCPLHLEGHRSDPIFSAHILILSDYLSPVGAFWFKQEHAAQLCRKHRDVWRLRCSSIRTDRRLHQPKLDNRKFYSLESYFLFKKKKKKEVRSIWILYFYFSMYLLPGWCWHGHGRHRTESRRLRSHVWDGFSPQQSWCQGNVSSFYLNPLSVAYSVHFLQSSWHCEVKNNIF